MQYIYEKGYRMEVSLMHPVYSMDVNNECEFTDFYPNGGMAQPGCESGCVQILMSLVMDCGR